MKMRVTMEVAGRHVDETVTGASAEDILMQVKSRVARELGWKGLFLNAMTPLAFAHLAVQRYNAAFGKSLPIPATADEFVALGQQMGYVAILPDS